MSLTQEKILANTKKYFETAKNNDFMTDELMTFLGESFIKAPASTMDSLSENEVCTIFDSYMSSNLFFMVLILFAKMVLKI